MRAKVGIVCIALLGLVCAAQASDSVLKAEPTTSNVVPAFNGTRDDGVCPPDSLYSHNLVMPDGDWSFGVSDTRDPADPTYTDLLRADYFSGVSGDICGLTFWGLSLQCCWSACTEDPMTFEIIFWEDDGGAPGAIVQSYTVDLVGTPTGLVYSGFTCMVFEVPALTPCVSMTNGWLSIQGVSTGSPDCWFLWGNSFDGDSSSLFFDAGVPQPNEAYDFAFCLQGTYVPIYGACCDDATGICENDVEMLDCAGRFLPDGTCADLDPACGYILGACCYPDATCEYKTELQCENLCGDLDGNGDVGFADYQLFVGAFGSCAGDPEFIAAADLDLNGCITLADYSLWVACYRNGGGMIGEWLGPNTNCDDCPCIVICPSGASDEGEPCGEDLNGGCNMDPPNYLFGTIALDETICGTGWAEGGTRDTDWYELTLTEEGVVTIMVEAEFPALTFLIDAGAGDCTDYAIVGSASTTLECDPITYVSPCVPAGLYYVWVGPSVFEGYPCTLDYYVTVSADTCPIGACCLTDGTCIPDVTEPACAAAGGWQWNEGLTCDDVVCPVISAEDFCEDAVRILPGETALGSTLNATIDTDFQANACGTSLTAPGVWFLVAGTGNELTATTCGDFYDYDTKLHVWCECNGAEWSCVGGNDDNCSGGASGLLSTVTWCSAPGHEYLVLVSGFSSATGLFELQIIEGATCDTPPACEPPVGACCADDGSCIGNLLEDDCATAGGTWFVGEDCVNGPFVCPAPCEEDTLTVEIFTDNYPSETTWEVRDAAGALVASGGPYGDSATLYEQDVCLDYDGCYTFTIFDAFGDGICCAYGQGYYNLLLNGTLIATGGEFDDEETVANIGGGCGALIGACCADDGTCLGNLEETECMDYNGTWYVLEDCVNGPFVCPAPCPEDTLVVEIFTDNYPSETTWELAEAGGAVIASGGPYDTAGTLYSQEICVPETGCYVFTIFDAFGDGICCAYGDGYYNILLNGALVATGGEFGTVDVVLNIGNGCGDPLGACCATDGTCIGTITEADCNTAGGTWYVDQDCASGAFTCPCFLECPAGSTDEGELCGEDLNGGCNADVYAFGTIACGETICGTGWASGGSRDTDWYELVLAEDSIITIEGSAEFPSLFFLIDPGPAPECSAIAIIDSVTADPCAIASYTSTCMPAGLYYVWAGPSLFDGWPCDLDYYVTVTCDPCAARPASAAQANVAVSAEVEHPSTATIAAPVKK